MQNKLAGKNNTKQTISAKVLLFISWKNIVHKKLRSFLTVVGIVIGIGSIFFLLSFGIGLQDLVTNEILGNASIKAIDVTNQSSDVVKLDDKQVNRIKQLGHQTSVGAAFSFPASTSIAKSEIDAVVFGVDQAYQTILSLPLKFGRKIEKDDQRVAVLNTATLRSMSLDENNKSILGQQVTLKIPIKGTGKDKKFITDTYKVIGVVDSGSGSEVYVPSFVFENAKVNEYSQVKVLADSANSVPGIRKQIESYGLNTASPIDTINEINQVFKFFNLVMAALGSIGMIIAILGMFNTLTISLLERIKEIGLMIAIGARNRDIRRLFILEALLLSAIGSVIGILLAVLASLVVNSMMNNMAKQRGVAESFSLFAYPWWLVLGIIIGMLLVGFIVAYLPARRAEKVNPIDALRRE